MSSYLFILSGSFFVKVTNKNGGDDCKKARKILFDLAKLSKINREIAVFTVYETNQSLYELAENNFVYYNFLRSLYDVDKFYIGNEHEAIVKFARDNLKTYDNIIILNGSNVFEKIFDEDEKKTISIKDEEEAWKYIVDEVFLRLPC